MTPGDNSPEASLNLFAGPSFGHSLSCETSVLPPGPLWGGCSPSLLAASIASGCITVCVWVTFSRHAARWEHPGWESLCTLESLNVTQQLGKVVHGPPPPFSSLRVDTLSLTDFAQRVGVEG